MSRRSVREIVFKLVYETIACGEVNELSVSMATANMDGDDKAYFDKVFFGIADSKSKLEDIIRTYARAYDYERLYMVDKSILLVAIYEILSVDDIPYKVSVNEAVELAKAYSTDRSASYINGILASVIRHMEELK